MTICGIVRPGKRVGRQLGFPTANLLIREIKEPLPADGVYAGWATLADGRVLPCVLSQGRHPTLPEGEATVEAHILDFSQDLYGQVLRVEYVQWLRGEACFDGVDALVAQMQADERQARRVLGQTNPPSSP